jgi:3'-5' exoribonuclease
MSRQYIDKLRDGDDLDDVFLAADKQLRTNKNGNPFVQVELRDRTGGLVARMWNAGDNVFRSFEVGDYVHAVGRVQVFQGNLQIILNHLDRVEDEKVDPSDFLAHTSHDIAVLEGKLRGYLLKLSNPHLRAIAECFLMDEALMRDFRTCPAGVKLHHAYVGGLLEHTVTMMEIAETLLRFYPTVDRDLILLGTFLHDIGKTRELTFARAFGYSDEGQLIGHITMGTELLVEKAAKAPDLTGEPVPQELVVRLKHMILSHHGTLEHGSPKVPMTAEAMLLHHIDILDTRMHMALKDLKDDAKNTTAWTPYNANLSRRFYKGGPSGELYSGGGESYD